jgi:hypothetical protein
VRSVPLEKSTTFQARKAVWEQGAQKEWSEAARFFDTNHKFLKDWRNDVGGHFHDRAAAFAIDKIEQDTVGTIELYRRDTGARRAPQVCLWPRRRREDQARWIRH